MHHYQRSIEQALITLAKPWSGRLGDAARQAILMPGKRLRPLLVEAVAQGCGIGPMTQLAVAMELFHCATLVADDLPAMDNAIERRGFPTLHRRYGEATAILVTYVLIGQGYEAITRYTRSIKADPSSEHYQRGMLVVEFASRKGGLGGLSGGQAGDLEGKALAEIIEQKTTALFELAAIAAWTMSLRPLEELPAVERLGYHLGMALQIADDLADVEEDQRLGRYNVALTLGVSEALSVGFGHVREAAATVEKLELKTDLMEGLLRLITEQLHL